ncbi:MAG: hypothetical protein Q9218_003631 [Villophora microphyllina]
MPDKPLTVLTYAASASLAAVALVYFFNPNQIIDGDSSTTSANTRKKGIVGLINPANDCFINSVLQSLASLGDLRLYLIREVHRRDLDNDSTYTSVPEKDAQGEDVSRWKLLSLQGGQVTRGLKLMLDQLNERPIYKKTISAQTFIGVLESAFGTRISRAQQDAQELLQIVAERLSEEYDAGKEARRRAKRRALLDNLSENHTLPVDNDTRGDIPKQSEHTVSEYEEDRLEAEEGFPLEGQTEARVECQHCHFVPKPTPTSFVMLNLMVAQKGTTTLNECFDTHFKTEFIDDYKCDKCRLVHAVQTLDEEKAFARTQEQKDIIQAKIDRVKAAIDANPEVPPERVQLPDIKHAPKRKIARHVQITRFPKILVIHLSRSMFDPGSYSQKNSAKLSFPERLPIGGILNRKNYKLLGLITHQGSHNSGHYETFRRQHLYPPISTPNEKKVAGPYIASPTPNASNQPSPLMSGILTPLKDCTPENCVDEKLAGRGSLSTTRSPNASTHSLSPPSTRPTSGSAAAPSPRNTEVTSSPNMQEGPTAVLSMPPEADSSTNPARYSGSLDLSRFRRKKKGSDRWWRISDDKVRECNTADVLAMQKDVYMLFYEMERGDSDICEICLSGGFNDDKTLGNYLYDVADIRSGLRSKRQIGLLIERRHAAAKSDFLVILEEVPMDYIPNARLIYRYSVLLILIATGQAFQAVMFESLSLEGKPRKTHYPTDGDDSHAKVCLPKVRIGGALGAKLLAGLGKRRTSIPPPALCTVFVIMQ